MKPLFYDNGRLPKTKIKKKGTFFTMKKKFLALILCLSLLIVPFGTVCASATTASDYQVGTADALIAAIAEINGESGDKASTITLTADIDLTGKTVTPLATFSGVLDGGNHTIKGLTLTATADNIGLIKVGTDCTIKNLVIEGASISSSKSSISVLIGTSKGTILIDNCTLKGSTVTGTSTSSSRVGGFIGYVSKDANSKVTISNCAVKNSTITSGKEIVGSMIGYAESAKSLTVTNCTAEATLSGSAYVGGIIGRSAATPAVYKNCVVDASIVSANAAGGISGGESSGGTSNTITFENCFTAGVYKNTGTNPKRSGGIIGYASSDKLIFKNCVSIAECDGAMVGNPCKNTNIFENCAGNRAFIGYMDISDPFTITESGSKMIGSEEVSMIDSLKYTDGKKLTINDTLYETKADIEAAVAAYKISAIEKLDMIQTQIDVLFEGNADLIAKAKATAMAYVIDVVGYQTNPASIPSTGTYDIRFVAYIDAKDYAEAGLQIQAKIAGELKTAANCAAQAVYESIYATIGDSTQTITVENLGNYESGYILAIKVTGVPVSVTEFTVTPYVVTAGTNNTVYGAATNVTVNTAA